jgi:hypothetical protein
LVAIITVTCKVKQFITSYLIHFFISMLETSFQALSQINNYQGTLNYLTQQTDLASCLQHRSLSWFSTSHQSMHYIQMELLYIHCYTCCSKSTYFLLWAVAVIIIIQKSIKELCVPLLPIWLCINLNMWHDSYMVK